MPLPLPPAFRKLMATSTALRGSGDGQSSSESESESDDDNPLGVSNSESIDLPNAIGKKNPLKKWAKAMQKGMKAGQ